jgi:VCBS repeat-containing protein
MLVASHIESGDQAVAAALPQIIGTIDTAIGYGTLRRAGGAAVEVTVGDPVHQGDVIETAADGQVGIRLIDGTLFMLSRGTRVVLDEFVCDPDGASHSALLAVTRGSFAFIAGRMARNGSLRIDTPVGSILGRAHAGGFGMLSLAALTFATMSDVQAADPNATFLDDDSITYKDLEHGTFELWTKEAIPRHIIVEDPGATVVLTQRGSSISVNQVANSPARMAELQAAQQAVLANFAKGYGPNGSSTPYYFNQQLLQPINFTQPDSSTTQNQLPPLESAPNPIYYPLIPPPLPPVPPTLNVATGPTLVDTIIFDTFTASAGKFVATSPNGTLTFSIAGGIAGNTVFDGVTYDISQTGHYGTLYVDSTTGAFIYVPDNNAVNALKAPTTESFTITVSDGTLSASQIFTITIDGANDAAVISGTTSGAVVEAGAVANAAPGTPSATGTLTDTDVDDPANTFTAISSPAASNKGYGTYTMTAAGVWTYTLNNSNPAVQALNVGGTLTDTFTVTTVDGTTQVVTITITGSNDAAVISGTTSGSVIEAGSTAPGTPVATGTLTDTDVDNAANTFTAISSPTPSDKGYGTFTMTAAGVWTYTLNNANPAVQALNAGDTLTDSFTVTTADGTTQVVTITITGANDAAIISGTTTGTVIEAGGVANAVPGTPTATGTLVATDADNPANSFTAVSTPTLSDKGYGTFTMTAAGVWTYTLNNSNPAVQTLNAGGTLTDTFTVTTVDGTMQVVTITIAGSNDTAIISGTTSGAVIEAGVAAPGTPVATGTLADTDVDNAANAFTAISSPTASDKGYGTFTMTAAGVWTYTLNNANPAVQALNAGDTLTDTFTVTTVDGTTQVVTVTISGSNDAAVISGTKTGTVIEAGGVANAVPGTPTATGTLTDTDVDNAANSFTVISLPTVSDKGYGTFTMTAAGVWTYTLNNANPAVQALNVGDTLTDTFTVTTVDGTTQVVTVTITGSNDAAAISGTTSGEVIEAGGTGPGTPVVTGTLTDTDVDNAANTFTAVSSPTRSDKGYGTFTMTAAGVWVYTVDNNNSVVDALNPGDTLTDTFTVRTTDGTTQVVTITIHGASDADPNDFDDRALGDHVITEPPPSQVVHGTPNGETIAGGGDVPQIVYAGAGNDTVNGTGVNDVLYGGSGNDTIKGNGGNDTIYGGSGRDDIDGSNGNDTIIGGFGGDTLRGGNGDDTFVYLSVADSNSTQFDTILDFQSGSDKINLAAFGALAFMALSPTAATVPPHTLAWIYDSASNQTIVYVNPTDQTLSIGDSSLVEIHLQGVTSVAESDFVHEPAPAAVAAAAAANEGIDPALLVTTASDGTVLTTANADASVDATVSESARVTDVGWTMPADEGFSFHFVRDRIDQVGSVRLASFGEAPAYATEDSDGDAVTTLASISSTHDPYGHATLLIEDHFTFNHEPAHASASATVTGDVAVTSTSVTVEHVLSVTTATAELQLAEHDAPGNSAGHSQSQHASHPASENASAAAEVQVAEHDTTPGNSAGHSQSQHASHTASENASAAAEVQVAEHDATPGNGAGHSQSQHASHTASQSASSAPPSEANPVAAPLNHPAPANAAEAAMAAAPSPGDSFQFKDDIAGPEHSAVVDVADTGHGHASGAHEAAAAIAEMLAAELSPTEQNPNDHASAGHQHVAGHAGHDLIV